MSDELTAEEIREYKLLVARARRNAIQGERIVRKLEETYLQREMHDLEDLHPSMFAESFE